MVSCNEKEPANEPKTEYDEAYYADHALVSSDSSSFASTDDGGVINFKTEGGQVVVYVDCGVGWTAIADSDWIDTDVSQEHGTLTVTAGQNHVEEELTASISLTTAESGIQFATIIAIQSAYDAPTFVVGSDEWRAPAVGALSTEVAVTASNEWTVENTAVWLTVDKTDTGISLTAAENDSTEERNAEVVLTCSDSYKPVSETINVIQDGKAYITIDSETLYFTAEQGSKDITVESNFKWECTTDADWINLYVSGSTLTVSVKACDSNEYREALVTVSAGDGAENVSETQLAVTQGRCPLILTYTITADGTTLILPLGGRSGSEYTVDCTVDWGDGSEVETVTEGFPTHTYLKAGEYDVTIAGTVTALCSYDINGTTGGKINYTLLTGVKQWGNTGLTSMNYALYNNDNLTSLPEDTTGSFAEVTTFERAFYDCGGLTSVPANLFVNCANVTSYAYVFSWCNKLTTVPNELFHNSPLVTTFNGMFFCCLNLASVPEDLFAKCPEVESFYQTFYNCAALSKIPTDIFDNNLKVTDFSGVFKMCFALSGESPYTVINGEKVHLYERLDHQDYFGVTNITSTQAFYDCYKLDDYGEIPDDWK